MTDLRKAAEIVLGQSEVLRVTSEGQFIWHEDADRMIEQGDFSHSPAMPYILKALRKREWVGLTDEEINWICFSCFSPKSNAHKKSKHFYEQLEAKLKEKNT